MIRLVLFFASVLTVAACDRYPTVIEGATYPILAKQARISGIVRLRLKLTDSGEVREAVAMAGHPLLAQEAEKNVKLWRFAVCDDTSPREIDFLYEFRLEDEVEGRPTTTRFRFEYPNRAILNSQAGHWMP